ncbi:MAG: hypothetical protein KDE27_10715 [Planctomycetes bacterium]|nr:hypothetical protein [Planctomycetota bacterium]
MSSMLARPIVSFAVVCSGLLAQNQVVPGFMAGIEGGSATNVPFGSNLACRYQVVFDRDELPWTGPRPIRGFSIRADLGDPNGSGVPAKGYLNVSVMMSTTHASASTASSTFDDNWGEDAQWLILNQPIQLPAQPAPPQGATAPRAANVTFQFPNQWWYGLTPARPNLPAPANLLIEIRILSQPSGAYPIDNLGGCVAPITRFGNQGPLCTVPANQQAPTLHSDQSMTAGSSFSWWVNDCPPNVGFVLAFNASSQGSLFGAYPVPYPMYDLQNPNLPSAALLAANVQRAAPDCWFNLVPAVTLFGVTNSNGVGTVVTQLPGGRSYVGFELFAQALIYSQTSNPLQVITTEGRSSKICGPLQVARIFNFYDGSGNPAPPPPTTGSVQYGLGPVIEVF